MDSMIWFTAFLKWFIGTFVVLLEYQTMHPRAQQVLFDMKDCKPVNVAFVLLFSLNEHAGQKNSDPCTIHAVLLCLTFCLSNLTVTNMQMQKT